MGMSARYLLDTHALIWWMLDAAELSNRARRIIAEKENAILVSAATLWEIAIKQRKGLLRGCDDYLREYPSRHARWGFGTLSIGPEDAVAAGSLEWSHSDPFDRMLVAQSQNSNIPLLTCDDGINAYHPLCIW